MRTMLPAIPQAFGNLKDVLRSVQQSLSGQKNALSLPKAKNALVIMVDGLGWANINNFAGHAPFLKKLMSKDAKGYCGFPSTTAASIMSLATGLSPSEHGFIGYKIYDRAIGEPVNLLTGLDSETVRNYSLSTTIAEQSSSFVVVSKPEYLGSGFSQSTFGDSKFIGEANIDTRFESALTELNSGSGKLIYLYVPELDQTAHRFGSNSDKWIQLLESVDSLTKRLHAEASSSRGIILTADHGVIDVPGERHIYLDECPALENQIVDVGGDPRVNFLYFKAGADLPKLGEALADWLGETGVVATIPDLVAAGIYQESILQMANLIPDLVLLPSDKRASYHRDFAKPASLAMVGQHGGLTNAEITIPVLRLGSYSSSLLVP